jgi:hypothetical protein
MINCLELLDFIEQSYARLQFASKSMGLAVEFQSFILCFIMVRPGILN